MTAHAYWRVYISEWNAPGGAFRTGLYGLKFLDSGGSEISRSGGSIIYSAEDPWQMDAEHGSGWHGEAEEAYGSGDGFWIPNQTTPIECYIGWHFSSDVDVASIRYTGASAASPRDFRFEYSDNGTDWTILTVYNNIGQLTAGDSVTYSVTNIDTVTVALNYVEVIETTNDKTLEFALTYVEIISSLAYTDLSADRPPKRIGCVIG